MKLLLDTCSLLWVAGRFAKLSSAAQGEYLAPGNTVFLSAASIWEIALKQTAGKLTLPAPLPDLIVRLADEGVETVPVNALAAAHVLRLPPLHKDPFDRLLVAQAILEGMAIVTPDPLIAQYPVRTIW